MPFRDLEESGRPVSAFENIRRKHPLVHAITNAVTINDVVNMILASGAAAACADNEKEVEEIVSISDALLLNTGMPEDNRLNAMILAGRKANELGIPVVLDPVGAGASAYRREFLTKLLSEVHVTAIRANMSEAAALQGMAFASQGVEAAGVELEPAALQELAERFGTVLAVTGETDYAVSGEEILISRTGTPLLKSITGAGCMLSGLLAASLAGNPGDAGRRVRTVQETLAAYGQAAEDAEREMMSSGHIGTGTFRTYLIDGISRMCEMLPGSFRNKSVDTELCPMESKRNEFSAGCVAGAQTNEMTGKGKNQ